MSDLDGSRGPAPRRAVPAWWPLLPLGLVVVLVVIVIQGATRPVTGAPTAARTLRPVGSVQVSAGVSPSRRQSETVAVPLSTAPTDERAIRQLGHPLLPGMTGGWQLLSRGDDWLSRIDPVTGRIDSTSIPGLNSGGPVSFLTGPDETLVRPLDVVDGYLLPDRYATQRTAKLIDHGPAFPGPDAEHLWISQPSGTGGDLYLLVDWRGHRAGPVIPVPKGLSSQDAVPDGIGGLVFVREGRVESVGPRRSVQLGVGTVLATGPSGVLILECPRPAPCRTVTATIKGVRRLVPSAGARLGPNALYEPGVISADGRTAAFVATPVSEGKAVTISLNLVDLRTGAVTRMAGRVPASGSSGQLAWSPDGRWLFAIVDRGEIVGVDHLGGVWTLDLGLPPQRQLVIRPGSR